MTSLLLAFAVSHALSIGFTLFTLKRLYHYIRRYRFDESKYTLLFGFIHLRWIAAGYLVLTFSWVFASLFILMRL